MRQKGRETNRHCSWRISSSRLRVSFAVCFFFPSFCRVDFPDGQTEKIALHPFTAYMPSDLAHFRRMGRTKHKKIEENERTGSFRKKNRMQEGRMRREAKNGKERHALQKGRGKELAVKEREEAKRHGESRWALHRLPEAGGWFASIYRNVLAPCAGERGKPSGQHRDKRERTIEPESDRPQDSAHTNRVSINSAI